ncbi:flippase [Natrialba chahannaoensis]|uniref:flippase n=1 Tax=Natrialba chahannaoensis TaxID=68911 RepID=UPI000A012AFA|nr:flippase [Natrialba chahannaoensis]
MSDSNENDSLSSITRGASLYFIGKIVVDVLGFVFQLILTRGLGAGTYGIYAYSKNIIGIFLVFTNLGTDKSLLKYIPQYHDELERQQFVLTLATITSLCAATIAAVSLFIFSPTISRLTLNNQLFVDVLRFFALILIFDTISRILYSVFRGAEKLEYEVLTNKLVRPVFRVSAAVLALGLGFSLIGVMVGLLFAHLLTLIISIYLFYTRFKLSLPHSYSILKEGSVRSYYNFSIPITVKDAGDILMNRVDILMVGFFLSSTAVGIYNIAVLLAGILALPLAAFNQLFPPVASRLLSNEKRSELKYLYEVITRWVFIISLIMAISLVTYRFELLSLFGEEFTGGSLVLTLFVLGQLVHSLGGANGYLLMMTDHQYLLAANQWAFGILNFVLNYIFIVEYGFIGAAVATASVFALLNITKTIELWYLEGLFPYSLSFLKPIIAGIFSIIPMHIMGMLLNGIYLVFVGTLIGVLTYIIIIISLGVEEEEKSLIKSLV